MRARSTVALAALLLASIACAATAEEEGGRAWPKADDTTSWARLLLDASTCEKALIELNGMGRRAAPLLGALLRHPDWRCRIFSLTIISKNRAELGTVLAPDLVESFERSSAETAPFRIARDVLVSMGERALPHLILALDGESDRRRVGALRTLRGLGVAANAAKRRVRRLAEGSSSPRIRLEAVMTLGAIDNVSLRTAEFLAGVALADGRIATRVAALEGLGRFPGSSARIDEALSRLALHSDAFLSGEAVRAVAARRSKGRVGVEVLTRALGSDHTQLRRDAARGLASCGAEASAALPKLIELARRKDEDHIVRFWAVSAAAAVGGSDDRLVRLCSELLGDDEWQVRKAAVDGCVSIGRRAVPELMRVATEETSGLKVADALLALFRISPTDERARSLAQRLLDDGRPEVRRGAAGGLLEVGPVTAGVAAVLAESLRDANTYVRLWAIRCFAHSRRRSRGLEKVISRLAREDPEDVVRTEASRVMSSKMYGDR